MGGAMTTKTLKPEIPVSFPAKEIEECVREYLAQEGETQAVLHGEKTEPAGSPKTIGPEPSIDSLTIVGMLVELEEKVGFELFEDVVKPGGYDSVDDVVKNLMPKLKRRWEKHRGGKS